MKHKKWIKHRPKSRKYHKKVYFQRHTIGRQIKKNYGSIRQLSNQEIFDEMMGVKRISGPEGVTEMLAKTFNKPFGANTIEENEDFRKTSNLSRSGLVTHIKSKIEPTFEHRELEEQNITTFPLDKGFLTVAHDRRRKMKGYLSDSPEEASKIHNELDEEATIQLKESNRFYRNVRNPKLDDDDFTEDFGEKP